MTNLINQPMASTLELSENFQIVLSTYHDVDIRRELAEMSGICDEAQENLTNDDESEVLEALAQNPTVSEETLVTLADNENLSDEAMVLLAKSSYAEVRRILAGNPHICEEAQEILINDNDDSVVEELIENNAFDKHVFLKRNR